MNKPYRTSGQFQWNDLESNQLAWPHELEFGDYRSEAASPGFELQLESPSVPSGPGEQYVNTSTWKTNPLRSHGGTGANVLLRWNNVPMDARAIDVVVHFHGFIHGSNEQMLRTVAGYSGLNLSGRVRPTIGILPRGRLITPEEVRQNQARLNELARKTGKEPAKARSDVQTFPGLVSHAGAGLEALIAGALQWFAQQRGGSAPLTIARLILTAHSGGGGALDRLVANHARRRVCNPDEVYAFDALYSEAGGLKSWGIARLAVDRSRQSNQPDSVGGLRVFYRSNTGTQPWSERLGRSLPPAIDPLSRFYRIDCSRLGHFEIPKQFGPPLLRDRTTDLSSFGPCAGTGGTPRTQVQVRVPPKQVSTGSAQASGSSVSPVRAPLPTDVRAWIRSTDRSAIELVADEALRRRFLQEIDWSREYFPGNPDAQNRRAPGRSAEALFNAMARVTPERRVPRSVRFHDVTRVVVSVPGQTDHKLFPEARDAFVRMRDAAASDAVQLQLLSSWRSVARQQAARLRQTNPNAVAPGISAHNYGLAIDLNMRVPGLSLVNVSTRARDKMANMVRMYRSPIYKWLALNGSRFGWFPYKREPWHWEYNPPGLKERFEGAAAATREFEFENTLRSEFEFAENESGVSGQNVPPNNRRSPDYVRWVQQALNSILGLQLAVDGDARVKTKNAIKSFQKQQGLFPDGIVGAKTEAALLTALKASSPGLSVSAPAAQTKPQPSRSFPPQSTSRQSTSALLQVIPDDPDYEKYIPIDYRLDAKKIVGEVAQDLKSNGESAHFWLDLVHFGLVAAEIFEVSAVLSTLGVVGVVASPLLAVVGIGLGLGAPYYEAAQEIAANWSATGFSRGVVMGADKRKVQMVNDYFGGLYIEPNRFVPNGQSIALGNYRMGLVVGFVQGRLLSENQRAIFWRDLVSRMGYQSYRGPSTAWNRSEWTDWYLTAAAIFRRDHLS